MPEVVEFGSGDIFEPTIKAIKDAFNMPSNSPFRYWYFTIDGRTNTIWLNFNCYHFAVDIDNRKAIKEYHPVVLKQNLKFNTLLSKDKFKEIHEVMVKSFKYDYYPAYKDMDPLTYHLPFKENLYSQIAFVSTTNMILGTSKKIIGRQREDKAYNSDVYKIISWIQDLSQQYYDRDYLVDSSLKLIESHTQSKIESLNNQTDNMYSCTASKITVLRLSKYLTYLNKKFERNLKDSVIDSIVTNLTADLNQTEEVITEYTSCLLSGDDVMHAYEQAAGCSSCMTDDYARYTEIYSNNPEHCELLVIYEGITGPPDTKYFDGAVGRCLIWTNNVGNKFIDRIYYHEYDKRTCKWDRCTDTKREAIVKTLLKTEHNIEGAKVLGKTRYVEGDNYEDMIWPMKIGPHKYLPYQDRTMFIGYPSKMYFLGTAYYENAPTTIRQAIQSKYGWPDHCGSTGGGPWSEDDEDYYDDECTCRDCRPDLYEDDGWDD